MKNKALLTDFYELTMAYSYFKQGRKDEIAYFDVFYRKNPDKAGYALFCGLEQIVDYLLNLSFNEDDIEFLRSKNIFDEEFLNYLSNFKFKGDLYSFKEGSVMFPHEPIMTIRANIIDAQIVETMILIQFNHQSLIATKTNRIVSSARGRKVLEFGARRAHGVDASIYGARAAYIAGVHGTSNTILGKLYGMEVSGTMAHSYVQSFDTELDAFRAYCNTFPNNALLLVDSYDTLKSGIPNAIIAFKELKSRGYTPLGIRIDSGDLAYLSKQARKMFDEAGLSECKICVSNSLDEYLIKELIIEQGAPIDLFGVGERLICAKSDPVFGGVYKLGAVEKDGVVTPKLKISDNVSKMTNPGFKQVYRLYDKDGFAKADLITLREEKVENGDIEIFDPNFTYKRTIIENATVRPMLNIIIKDGNLVEPLPTLQETKQYLQLELKTLYDEVKRFENPHDYYVDLSEKLWDLRTELIHKFKKIN